MNFEKTFQKYKGIIDSGLKTLFEEKIYESKDFIQSSYFLLKEFTLKGGKRLRPVLTIMAFKALCNQEEENIYLPAVGIELFHTSTLIHDDIMDEDSERRGMLSMHKNFENLYLERHEEKKYEGGLFRKTSERVGVSIAILLGNILYALTDSCFTNSLFETDKIRRALDVIGQTYRVINEGQMLDILSEQKKDFTENDYLEVIEKKTAHLFMAAIQVGAIFGRAVPQQFEALSKYAIDVGLAFQLQDDLFDISPGLKGHSLGSDIKRGKYTLLMIKAFENANSKQKHVLLSALGNDNAAQGTIQSAIDVLFATGAVEYVKEKADQKLREGKSSLDNLGLSKEGHDFFDGLVNFLAQRTI
jgi:geranylgeranyl diphosphate synthase type I